MAQGTGRLADRRSADRRRHPPAGAVAAGRWLTVAAVASSWAAAISAAEPRHIILFIGDGMGTGQVAAARAFLGRPLVFESFPIAVSAATTPAVGNITDSAAAATAMSTGRRVGNGVISRDLPGSGSNLVTLTEHFRPRGRLIGLVTTSYLVDATPAAFCAHAAARRDYAAIIADYLRPHAPDLLLGGGGGGLTAAAMAGAGYTVAQNRADLQAACTAAVARIGGLFGGAAMPYEYDGLGLLPTLEEMTVSALRFLEAKAAPFFLMVEGGRIDHACHANDLARCLGEMVGFDRAVAVAAAWAARRADTLIVVTADHETGGLEILEDRGPGEYPAVRWTTTGHTSDRVPLYAWGYGAGRSIGVEHLTDIRALLADPLFPPPLVCGLIRRPAGSFDLAWRAVSGRTYRVECRPAVPGTVWLFWTSLTAEVDGTVSADIGPMISPPSARIYRVTETR